MDLNSFSPQIVGSALGIMVTLVYTTFTLKGQMKNMNQNLADFKSAWEKLCDEKHRSCDKEFESLTKRVERLENRGGQ
jgi:hypothetical protein